LLFDIAAYDMQTLIRDSKEPTHVRYTDIEEAIRLARRAGIRTIHIVRALSGSVPYLEALKIAKKAAPILGLTIRAFMDLRRNC
jgi:hypothetical protein